MFDDILKYPFGCLRLGKIYPKGFICDKSLLYFVLDCSIPNLLKDPITIHDLVKKYFDIQAVPKRYFFELLSFFTTSEMEQERLLEFASAEGQVRQKDWSLFAFTRKRINNTLILFLWDIEFFRECLGNRPLLCQSSTASVLYLIYIYCFMIKLKYFIIHNKLFRNNRYIFFHRKNFIATVTDRSVTILRWMFISIQEPSCILALPLVYICPSNNEACEGHVICCVRFFVGLF